MILRLWVAPQDVSKLAAQEPVKPLIIHILNIFDDEPGSLLREAGELISLALAKNYLDPRKPFSILFSAHPFPESTYTLEWLKSEDDGNWYTCPELEEKGWLCPVLLKYFDYPPAKIYVRLTEKAP